MIRKETSYSDGRQNLKSYMDETNYLLSSPNNKEHLLKSINSDKTTKYNSLSDLEKKFDL